MVRSRLTATERPNILWICTDQQRFDTISALGNPHIRTPNLDRLAEDGTAFTHAYCQNPICTPSRASFLTGMYPSTIHACRNGNEVWGNSAPLVSKLLADSGYDCGLVGKLHLSAAQGRVEQRPDDGFRVFHWSHSSGKGGHAYADWLREQGHTLKSLQEKYVTVPAQYHQTAWCAEKAIEFINDAGDQPWLFCVNTFDPHPPLDPPQEYLARFDLQSLPGPLFRESDLEAQARLADVDFQSRPQPPEAIDAKGMKAAYYAMIELIDEQVGRMLEAVERTGQRENTVVIFTSDHGEMLGDHGLIRKGCRFYEGLVRVPLLISWPGHIHAGARSDALVELIDIAPTLLDLAQQEIPERVQGRSLMPLLTGAVPSDSHRDSVRCEYYDSVGTIPNSQGSYGTMYRDHRYKMVVYHGHSFGELFDLQEDPGEFINLWEDNAHLGLRSELLLKAFDQLAFAIDLGPKQVADY